MESGPTGSVVADSKGTVVSAHGQWRNSSLRYTTQKNDGRKRRRPPVPKTKIFRGGVSTNCARDRARVVASTPMMVADFVFRKQVEWLVENTGVRDDFKDVAQKIWFSYLTHYMPDLKKGVKAELGGNMLWHLGYPRCELPVLLNCARGVELDMQLKQLQGAGEAVGRQSRMTIKTEKMTKECGHLRLKSISDHLKYFRPTPGSVLAVVAIALYVCQEDILISDLLRWARLLKLPLLDMSAYKATASPDEVRGFTKLTQKAHSVGQYYQIEKKFLWIANRLLDTNVGKLSPLPVAPFVERFIQELNLPLEMIPFVLGLLDKVNSANYRMETVSVKSVPFSGYHRGMNLECHLMTCIFYALRILFVLDDAVEEDISAASRRMQVLAPALRLFNFGIWYQHLMHRRALLFKHTMLSRQSYSAAAQAHFVKDNLVPASIFQLKKPLNVPTSSLYYQQLQSSLQKTKVGTLSRDASTTLFVDLPPTVRPYRAHTEALAEHYPELAVDFSQYTIKHLLKDRSWLNGLGVMEELSAEMVGIEQARKIAYDQTQMFRHFRNRHTSRNKLLEESYLPLVALDLIRTMADMIDHQPKYLIGNIIFLELAFFPKNPMCIKVGKGQRIKVLKTV